MKPRNVTAYFLWATRYANAVPGTKNAAKIDSAVESCTGTDIYTRPRPSPEL